MKLQHLSWIAWKQLVGRSGLGLSFMTTVSIVGVSIGVAVLIVVLSVMGGFAENLQERMLRIEPHVELQAQRRAEGFSLKDHSIDSFKKQFYGVTAASAFTQTDAVARHRKILKAIDLIGIQPETAEPLWYALQRIISGSIEAVHKKHRYLLQPDNDPRKFPGIILGEGLAGSLGVDVGDKITLINPYPTLDAQELLGGASATIDFVVVATFLAGHPKYDEGAAFVDLAYGRRFLPEYDQSLQDDEFVTGVGLKVADPLGLSAQIEKLKRQSDFGLKIVSWEDVNQSMLFALKLEKFAMGSILMLIVVVAAFSISGTMMMTVFHKKKDISMLQALGANRWQICGIFMFQGLSVGALGVLIGAASGLLLTKIVSSVSTWLPDSIHIISDLPVKFIPETYVVVFLCAFMLSLIAAAYPAWTASNQLPSEGL